MPRYSPIFFCFLLICYLPVVVLSFVNRKNIKYNLQQRYFCLHDTRVLSDYENLKINELKEACKDRKLISSEQVAFAIAYIETVFLSTEAVSLQGKWELVYSSLIPGGYFPVCEICDFYGYSIGKAFLHVLIVLLYMSFSCCPRTAAQLDFFFFS